MYAINYESALREERLDFSKKETNEIEAALYSVAKVVSRWWAETDGATGEEPRIEHLDCRHRLGFIPHDHNMGGYEIEVPMYTCQMWDFGFEDEALEHLDRLSGLGEQELGEDANKDEIEEAVDRMDDMPMALFYFQAMLHTDNEVTIKICMYFSDMPYFRTENGANYIKTFEIDFLDASDLRKKLAKIHHRLFI